jgi:hypothetical protein
LHASVIEIGGKAVVFSANHQSGKSCLAASCMQAGHALITDEYAAIRNHNGIYYVDPGFPQMHMCEDQAAYFLDGYASQPVQKDNTGKIITPIGSTGFGVFCCQSQPLGVIYIPQRSKAREQIKNVTIQPVPKPEAVSLLMQSGMVTYYRRWFPLQQHNIRQLTDLVNRIPARAVRYPNGYQHLPGVRNAILEDVKKIAV